MISHASFSSSLSLFLSNGFSLSFSSKGLLDFRRARAQFEYACKLSARSAGWLSHNERFGRGRKGAGSASYKVLHAFGRERGATTATFVRSSVRLLVRALVFPVGNSKKATHRKSERT